MYVTCMILTPLHKCIRVSLKSILLHYKTTCTHKHGEQLPFLINSQITPTMHTPPPSVSTAH